MKETSSGPRKWAFVVIAGGTVFSLPFLQKNEPDTGGASQPLAQMDVLVTLPEKPVIAEPPPLRQLIQSQAVIPSLTGDLASGLVEAGETLVLPDGVAARESMNSTIVSSESVRSLPRDGDRREAAQRDGAQREDALPAWTNMGRSALDELIDHAPPLPEFVPTQTLPLQPLRPWIQGPPTNVASGEAVIPPSSNQATSFAANQRLSPVATSPWQDAEPSASATGSNMSATNLASSNMATSTASSAMPMASHTARVDTWPHEELTPEQRARFLTGPAPKARELVSAIVPPDQVLYPPTEMAQATRPTLSRTPPARPVGAQVKFGQQQQSSSQLPDDRKSHVIFQPR